MYSVIHFEIEVENPARAMAFYEKVFGWQFEDYSQFVNTPYWGVITKPGDGPGINGGLQPRTQPIAEDNTSPRAFVCTVVVDDYGTVEKAILDHGGKLVYPKHALPGMAWQGYYQDTEGNTIGIHQPDENAA